MSPEEFVNTLSDLLERKPFQRFTVELHNGKRLEFDRPTLAYRGGSASGFARDDATSGSRAGPALGDFRFLGCQSNPAKF